MLLKQQSKLFSLLTLLLLLVCGCGDDDIPVPTVPMEEEEPTPTGEPGTVTVWTTNGEGSVLLSKSTNLLPFKAGLTGGIPIGIDTSTALQTIDGFGAALTGSSAFVLREHLTDAKRATLLRELFTPEAGIGISFMRITIGASDFSTADYTYNDNPAGGADPDQSEFSLGRDTDHLVPVLQEIMAISPDLKIMATPWSAPAWMKTNGDIRNGGQLRGDLLSSYAQYFVVYLRAMSAAGISIYAISVQNEPLLASGYPTMEMEAAQQSTFIRDHLGPALAAADLDTKIIIYDHNWDDIKYPLDVLSDDATKEFIAGTAFHCYAGDVSAMSQVNTQHPDRGIYFTECSGGGFSTDFGTNLSWNTDNLLVGATRNWAKTVLFWNLALNENSGPQNGGCKDCRGVVTINAGNGNISRNVEYYLLGHTAKFVQPGAVRIPTPTRRGEGISQVAFLNPDRSRVLVAFNHNSQTSTLRVTEGGDSFQYSLPAGNLVTFTW
ncbi:glycoside hydrolase family 30 protein [Neolewinella antarctica]|uniref:Glucosylceramidase n=1 Tax=Neolewinella antarctica TaxID=442734 RepID=A0ABX0X9N1_9BACT|nr:glycoside hydrolase family 30 beta sandwich domain-containing protein [Neolewinella antarctica]NJC25634.1 glucosylceramidase [Neolewinella antarctica]